MKKNFAARRTSRSGLVPILLGGGLLAVGSASQATAEHYGPAMNYRMNCEGCHQQDGSGQPGYIPALRGNVARFLALPEGRAYLARVPGTAQSLLTDAERAEVLTWIVQTFDPQHVPADFKPYQQAELAQWRYDALSQPSVVRASLVAQLDPPRPVAVANAAPKAAVPMAHTNAGVAAAGKSLEPPAAFAICGACHTVTPDGAPGIGPNLRGVVGRKTGASAGFTYSPAMSGAGFVWTKEALDDYLRAPGDKVPGNYMIFSGLPDAAERAEVIEYLESLR
jgi:cytochrome c